MSEKNQTIEPEDSSEGQETLKHVLPPKKYKLKVLLMFTDLFAIIVYVYYLLIRSIIGDVSRGSFSFVSNRMFSFYCVLVITAAVLVLLLVFKDGKRLLIGSQRAEELEDAIRSIMGNN